MLPEVSLAIPLGPVPTAMVLVTDVPTILETVLEPLFATQMLPEGSLVIPMGLVPTAMVLVTDVPTILETVPEL